MPRHILPRHFSLLPSKHPPAEATRARNKIPSTWAHRTTVPLATAGVALFFLLLLQTDFARIAILENRRSNHTSRRIVQGKFGFLYIAPTRHDNGPLVSPDAGSRHAANLETCFVGRVSQPLFVEYHRCAGIFIGDVKRIIALEHDGVIGFVEQKPRGIQDPVGVQDSGTFPKVVDRLIFR